MPRYLFKVINNLDPTTEVEGVELPDHDAAWREATVYAGELFKDVDGNLRPARNGLGGHRRSNIHILIRSTRSRNASFHSIAVGFTPGLLVVGRYR
jgi:hypothetical protein